MMVLLHAIFNIILVTSSLLVLTSENPVHSVLLLILIFCDTSAILILLKVEFLALAFVMIYVGALAVLFLFVVMMLNIKMVPTGAYSHILLVFAVAILAFLPLYISIDESFFAFKNGNFIDQDGLIKPIFSTAHNFAAIIDNLENIDVLGQALFNFFMPCVLIAGLLLLVAMIGAIVLTLKFSGGRKNELSSRQLSRSDNFISFLK